MGQSNAHFRPSSICKKHDRVYWSAFHLVPRGGGFELRAAQPASAEKFKVIRRPVRDGVSISCSNRTRVSVDPPDLTSTVEPGKDSRSRRKKSNVVANGKYGFKPHAARFALLLLSIHQIPIHRSLIFHFLPTFRYDVHLKVASAKPRRQ